MGLNHPRDLRLSIKAVTESLLGNPWGEERA